MAASQAMRPGFSWHFFGALLAGSWAFLVALVATALALLFMYGYHCQLAWEQDKWAFNLGVSIFKCLSCRVTPAVPFSCKTRIGPSCVARKAEQSAAQLGERLPLVPHRHLVISLPKKMGLRERVREDRRLFRRLARLVTQVLRGPMRSNIHAHRSRREELRKARPGILGP